MFGSKKRANADASHGSSARGLFSEKVKLGKDVGLSLKMRGPDYVRNIEAVSLKNLKASTNWKI